MALATPESIKSSRWGLKTALDQNNFTPTIHPLMPSQIASSLEAAATSLFQPTPATIFELIESEDCEDADVTAFSNFYKALKALKDSEDHQSERRTKEKCTQCHASFTEESNGRTSVCVTLHDVPNQPKSVKGTSESGRCATFECKRCLLNFEVEVHEENNGQGNGLVWDDVLLGYSGDMLHCFDDRHTTNPSEITLRATDWKKKGYGHDDNESVRLCI